MTGCWFADTLPDAGPCEGRMVKAHLIKQQTLVREVGAAACEDPRSWVPACGGWGYGNAGHHGLYRPDGFRPVPRELLPPALEEFAAEHGLGWTLDRIYGPLLEEQAA